MGELRMRYLHLPEWTRFRCRPTESRWPASGGEMMDRCRSLLTQGLRSGVLLLVLMATITGQTPRAAAADTTFVVDDDGRGTASDCNASQKAFSSVQAAVDVATPGSTILVCPGTYAEQVAITKSNLTVCGSGQGVTVLRPSAVPATVTGVLLPYPVAPILLVDGATGVTISGITVDGSVAESGVSNLDCPQVGFYAGIHFRNASGTVDSAQVMKVQ